MGAIISSFSFVGQFDLDHVDVAVHDVVVDVDDASHKACQEAC